MINIFKIILNFFTEQLAEDDVKPTPKVIPVAAVNKWAGEDEDDDIKVK